MRLSGPQERRHQRSRSNCRGGGASEPLRGQHSGAVPGLRSTGTSAVLRPPVPGYDKPAATGGLGLTPTEAPQKRVFHSGGRTGGSESGEEREAQTQDSG